jgi:hypothetical protein
MTRRELEQAYRDTHAASLRADRALRDWERSSQASRIDRRFLRQVGNGVGADGRVIITGWAFWDMPSDSDIYPLARCMEMIAAKDDERRALERAAEKAAIQFDLAEAALERARTGSGRPLSSGPVRPVANRPRRGMSARLRFAVLQRDGHRCVYCGRAAPDVRLHVDHVHPWKLGGTNEMTNLVTACEDCNLGKSDRVLAQRPEARA